MSDTLQDLHRDVYGLLDKVHGWSVNAWQARSVSGGTRAERMATLAVELAEIGRRAGTGVPDGVRPPRLADHALADQIAVLAGDLVTALGDPRVRTSCWVDLAWAARDAVAGARRDLGWR